MNDSDIVQLDEETNDALAPDGNSNTNFKSSPSRQGSCYDCKCAAFIPKAGHPTTCICGHSIYRHHLYLGN